MTTVDLPGDAPGAERRRRWERRAAVVLAALVPFAFWWFQNDDAAITFAFARSWARGLGLGVAAPGMARVEGYSNFAWMIVLALGARLGVSVVVTAKVLAALAVAATTRTLLATLRPEAGRLASLCCLPAAGVVIWAASGLENPLRDLLLVGLGVALHRQRTHGGGDRFDRRWVVLATASAWGLVAVRPDGVIPVGVALVAAMLGAARRPAGARSTAWREVAAFVGATAAGFGALTAWRIHRFGWPWPNPVYAKAPRHGFVAELVDVVRLDSLGWSLLWRYLLVSGLVLVVPAFALGARRLVRHGYGPMLVVLLSPGVVAVASPDWMADGRFYTSLCWALLWGAAWGLPERGAFVRSEAPRPGASALDRRRVGSALLVATVVVGVLLDVRLGVIRWSGRLPEQVTRQGVSRGAQRFVELAAREHLDQPFVFARDAGGILLDEPRISLLDSANLNEPVLSHVYDDEAAALEYVYQLQRPEIIEVFELDTSPGTPAAARLTGHGYRSVPSEDGRPLWVTTSAGAVGDDVGVMLTRLSDPATPPCELAALARGVWQHTRGRLPARSSTVAASLGARAGVESAFAAFVLDPHSPARQHALIDRLHAHDWSPCPPRPVSVSSSSSGRPSS